jgi:hypothetical protein
MRNFPVPALRLLKFFYPRRVLQGGNLEHAWARSTICACIQLRCRR